MSGRWANSTRRSRLPKNWSSQIVPRILKRDGNRCTECDNTTRLEVHHISDPDNHDDANLTTLCHHCHARHTTTEAAAARRPRPSAKRTPPRHPGLA